jgi:hypothetical protein
MIPLFGQQKSHSSAPLKKLEGSVYLADEYLLAMDQSKSIFMHRFSMEAQKARYLQNKTVGVKVFSCSNFIELHPTG